MPFAEPPMLPRLEHHLLGRGATRKEFCDLLHHATSLAADSIYGATQHVQPHDAPSLLLDDIDFSTPLRSADAALTELRSLWLDHAVYYHHPRYISHLNCPITTTAVAAEILATSLNTAVESWDQAGPAADIEQRLIQWISTQIGFTPQANGVFTSGGSQSNLQGLAIARNKARRIAPLHSLALLTSHSAHYSVRRAADLLGFEEGNVFCVNASDHPTSSDTLDPHELERVIQHCRKNDLVPAAVVATAGTTDRGLIDPLASIAQVCAKEDIHFHVDAAYGGAACLSSKHSGRLRGIECADSVTIDFHKTFYQPVACSAILARNGHDLTYVSTNAEYLNPADAPQRNLADFSLQTTRRFDALKLWVTLRTVGADAIGEAFDRCLQLAADTAELITHDAEFAALDLYEQPHLSTVLFSLHEDPLGALSEEIRNILHHDATAAIAITRLGGRRVLKLTILDPSLTLDDIAIVLREVVSTGTELVHRRNAASTTSHI